MKMNDEYSFAKLRRLFEHSPVFDYQTNEKIIVFSDLHLGSGGRNDDFRNNADLFMNVLQIYKENDYNLILNGDVEELQRSSLRKIQRQWQAFYELLDEFHSKGKLRKIIGNHDMDLSFIKDPPYSDVLYDSFILRFPAGRMHFFHGHQASFIFEKYNAFVGHVLRYLANPLGIKNFAYDQQNQSRFQTERRVYLWGKNTGTISVIGHTHRPLFDSMDKADHLRNQIEQLIREYILSDDNEKKILKDKIFEYRNELFLFNEKKIKKKFGVYNEDKLIVPCVFNSGTVIGKSGLTGLEIFDGKISLVHWFNSSRNKKYLNYPDMEIEKIEGQDLYKVRLDTENLDYIFARVQLLTS